MINTTHITPIEAELLVKEREECAIAVSRLNAKIESEIMQNLPWSATGSSFYLWYQNFRQLFDLTSFEEQIKSRQLNDSFLIQIINTYFDSREKMIENITKGIKLSRIYLNALYDAGIISPKAQR